MRGTRKKNADVKITDNRNGSMSAEFRLASGAIMQRTDYTSNTWDTGTQWTDGTYSTPEAKIQKAMEYYSREPLVNKSVKLLAQLSNDTFKMSAEDKNIENFFKTWWKDIGGMDFQNWFFLEYYRSGNIITMKTLVPYVPASKTNKKSKKSNALASESKEAHANYNNTFNEYLKVLKFYKAGKASKTILKNADYNFTEALAKWSLKSIPGAYTVLNPLAVKFQGPSDLPWMKGMYLKVTDNMKKTLLSPSKDFKDVIKSIPKEITKEIMAGTADVPLPSNICSAVFRDKQPYEDWAEPLCSHAFEALEYKRELREMDRHTVRSVRNRILKVTIGSDKYPVTDPKELSKLAADFNNPSRNLTIFWNHTLKIEFIEPNLDSLNTDKYQPAMEDIRNCFGVAPVLTGESGSSLGNNVINVKGLVELVQEGQDAFISWFNKEAKLICEAMGLAEQPECSFNKLNLKDENAFMGIIMQLVDRQLLSYETAIDTIGFYFPKELERLRGEIKIRTSEGILMAQKAPTQSGGGGDKGTVSGNSGNTDVSGQSGRPKGVKEPGGRKSSQNKPKSPSGQKIIASAMEENPELISVMSDFSRAARKHSEDEDDSGFIKTSASSISKRYGMTQDEIIGILKSNACSMSDVVSMIKSGSDIMELTVKAEQV